MIWWIGDYFQNWTASRNSKLRLDFMFCWMVMDIHCPEISRARGSSPTMLPMLVGRKRTVETSRPLRWSRTSGCGYYKEHIIPVFRRVAPLPRDFPFHIHSHLPIKAVQFTILSIIASGYKIADAFIYKSVVWRKLWYFNIWILMLMWWMYNRHMKRKVPRQYF